MKRAVSISIGSSSRDKAVEIELLGEKVLIERIGTDGDIDRAAKMFTDLDGKVDAFGVGGALLSFHVNQREYPFHSLSKLIKNVKHTPVVDGYGLKSTIEYGLAAFVDANLSDAIPQRRALITSSTDRYGQATGFVDAGYETIHGDLMFGLELPFPMRKLSTLHMVARTILPIVGRLPISWIYPTGDKQLERKPKWEKYFNWAAVIAGDAHMIIHFMPYDLQGKIIVTNTTTEADVDLFRQAGVRYLVTSTPVFEGRSFGTNMMEAALVAVAGKGRILTTEEIESYIEQLDLKPQIRELY